MALFEVIQRQIHKHGLVPKLIAGLPYISFLLSMIGVFWIFYLPVDSFRKTYISENALMPSQAYNYYRESEWNFLRGYRNEIHKLEDKSIDEKNLVMKGFLNDLGYVVADHKFSDLIASGSNIYGILNAKGDGSESMVLTAPWYVDKKQVFNENGVSLVIALAKYFARWTVWSKNIIIVFPENSDYALRSWVNDYHNSLDLTAGSIESAINIEFPGNGDYFEYMKVYYEGINGQLPNLDLLNSVISIGEHEGLTVSLQDIEMEESKIESYEKRLKILLSGIKELVLAGIKPISNGCNVFSGYRIQAITLRGVGATGNVDITTLGRVVEATFRSVNNLLEKFHQSFFFYLMLAPRNFISIGTYLPSAVCFSISYAIISLSQILNSGFSFNYLMSKSSIQAALIFATIILFSSILGLLILVIPLPTWVAFYSLLVTGIFISTLPTRQILLTRLNFKDNYNPFILKASSAYLLQSISLLYTSLTITSILVVHFSLAYTLGILMLPLTFIRPIKNNYPLQKHINSVCLFFSCPWIVVLIVGILDENFQSPTQLMMGLLNAWRKYDCWIWFIVIFVHFPCWLVNAYLGSAIIDKSEYKKIEQKQQKQD